MVQSPGTLPCLRRQAAGVSRLAGAGHRGKRGPDPVGPGRVSRQAFYLPLDENRFTATGSTVGPWFAEAQHVGPPSALLTRAVERCAPREPPLAISRIVIEVLGAVPIGEVTVQATVERPGRTIELVSAELSAG